MTDPTAPSWATGAAQPWDPALEPEAQQHQSVMYDLYPARLCPEEVLQNSQYSMCWRGRVRVIVTTTKAFFFIEVPEYPGIGLLHSEEIISASGGKNEPGGIRIELASGTIRTYKDQGCGCGSRLRSLRPFPSFSLVSPN